MKKILLLSALAAVAVSAQAETKFYTFDTLGEIGGVSPNGKYVAIADLDDDYGYRWCIDEPEKLVQMTGTYKDKFCAYGVDDNGLVVGNYFKKNGSYQTAYWENGEVKDLPMSPNVINLCAARCITADGGVIGGYMFYKDPTSEIGGRNYPCRWVRNDEGEYELDFEPIPLPDHQGFITTSMNADGSILGGRLYVGAGSEVPALFKDGELVFWNKLETRLVPFIYKGEIQAYFEHYFVDGMDDYSKSPTGGVNVLLGEFSRCDAQGNFYGRRDVVLSASEDGLDCDIASYATIYNPETEEWTELPTGGGIRTFSCGINGEFVFCNGSTMLSWDNGEMLKDNVQDKFGFTSPTTFTGITDTSADGKVLAGIREQLNPATGENEYYPVIVVLDEPLYNPGSGIEVVQEAEFPTLLITEGRIDVVGAEAAVYALNGTLAGQGSTVHVAHGVYVVKVADKAVKVLVK